MSFSGKAFVPMMLLLSCTVLSTLSFAKGDTDFSNSGGTLTGTSDGLSLSGSTLVAVIGWNGGALVTGNLGTVAFTTGALNGGSLANGGTFAAGGMFTVDGDGANGIPTGVLFSGSFSGTSTWVLVTLANGTHPDRGVEWDDGRPGRGRRDRAVNHQHGEGIFRRLNHDFRWRYASVGGT